MRIWIAYLLGHLVLIALFAYSAQGDSSVVFIRPASRPDLYSATGIVVGVNDQHEGIVITASHLHKFGDLVVGDGKSWRMATTIGRDEASDLSALLIRWPGPSTPLAASAPPFGGRARAWGASSGWRNGKTQPSPFGTITVDWGTKQGDSGAAVIGQAGRVIGVLSGSYFDKDHCGNVVARQTAFGPNIETIRRNLKIWGWECKDGRCRRIGIQQPAWTPISQSSQGAVAGRVGDTATVPAPLQGPPGKSIVGPQGRPGTPGQDGMSIVGPVGPQGQPGNDAVFDLSQIPPITIELMGENGEVAKTLYVRPGGTLQLPPMKMTTIGADGTRISKVRPLGGEFKLKFFEQEK